MSSGKRRYPSDLSDTEWELIQKWIPKARPGGRPRTTDVRAIFNAILYLNRTGCAWRYLPVEFPPWQTVYDYFWKWSHSGFLAVFCRKLAKRAREKAGRRKLPRLGIIDSQSVRTHYGEQKGWDAYKKIRGRKRHILVDSLGLLWFCKAHSATQPDHRAAIEMMKKIPENLGRSIDVLLADGAYRKKSFASTCSEREIELVTLSARKLGSNIKPKRWIVERTFAWFNLSRRLARDYERKTIYSEAMVYTAMLPILLKRLFPSPPGFITLLFRHAPGTPRFGRVSPDPLPFH